MRSLFFKIFLSFWTAQALIVALAILGGRRSTRAVLQSIGLVVTASAAAGLAAHATIASEILRAAILGVLYIAACIFGLSKWRIAESRAAQAAN